VEKVKYCLYLTTANSFAL